MAKFSIPYKDKIYICLIDDEDLDKVSKGKWRINKQGDYTRVHGRVDSQKTIKLHRYILGIKDSRIKIDHINNDPLDNRKNNLRICTEKENTFNQKLRKTSRSGFKGVTYWKRDKNWKAQIGFKDINYHIGYYDTKEEAAKAYDREAKRLFGKFAKLNYE